MNYRTRQLTRYRLCPTGICYADEGIHEDSVFLMVPVTQHDSELSIVIRAISFIRRMQQERRAQTIHIYSLRR